MSKVLTEAHLLKLREDIALVINDVQSDHGDAFAVSEWSPEAAERITRIPLLRALLVDNMVDLPPERVGHLMGLHKSE